jgi:nitrite reductase (NADH) large subunit
MAGGHAQYEGTVMSNRLKVVGIDLVSAGEIDVDGNLEAVITKDDEKYIYRKVVVKDDTIVGCILLGDITGNREILKAMENRMKIGALKEEMLVEGFDFKRLEG